MMTLRWPHGVDRALDLEPINRHARAHMLSGTPGDLTDAQAGPRHRHGIKDNALMRIQPLGDLRLVRFHRGRSEELQQSPAFLLLAFFMGP